RYWRITE
ncbi:peptidase M10 family protein, partial [Vibrio cholerae HC-17A1]